jgi:uncharacterized protein YdaT
MFKESEEGQTHYCEAGESEAKFGGKSTLHTCGKPLQPSKEECEVYEKPVEWATDKNGVSGPVIDLEPTYRKKTKPKQDTSDWEKSFIEEFDETLIFEGVQPKTYHKLVDFICQIHQKGIEEGKAIKLASTYKSSKVYIMGYKEGKDEAIKNFATGDFIRGEEAEKFRKEVIDEYLKTEEGKVYQDYQELKKQSKQETINQVKEIIKKERDTWSKESIGDKALQSLEKAFLDTINK